jgi:hypothetical protein
MPVPERICEQRMSPGDGPTGCDVGGVPHVSDADRLFSLDAPPAGTAPSSSERQLDEPA